MTVAAAEALTALTEQLAAKAAKAAARAGLDAAHLRWAAARAAVAAAIRAIADARDEPTGGRLFDPALPDADDAHRAAARCVAATSWPGEAAPPASIAAIGAAYPTLLAASSRKRAGAWFTPARLAQATTRRALAPLGHVRAPRVCDPAAGAGAFLVAALAELARTTGLPRAHVAAHCLFGVDSDATATSLAAWTLREACGDDAPEVATIERHVVTGDGLRSFVDGSFDAVLGNPPWDTLQQDRREDRARTPSVADRAALRREFAWLGRGKVYTYRLFVERALRLLRPGGRLGMVVPASLYFDRDAAALRDQLLDTCDWEWLFGFENRARVFAIDSRYRFAAIVAERGGPTSSVRAAFLQRDLEAWSRDDPPHLCYPRSDLRALSPNSAAFVEVRDERDLDLLRRMHASGAPLTGDDARWSWRQGDYNMTSDRPMFRERAAAEAEGYRLADDGVWRCADRPALRTLYQGGMIHNLDPNAGAYAGGAGRAVRWRRPRAADHVEPMYLTADDGPRRGERPPVRTVLRALSNATNERTAIACLLADEPCGNSLGVLTARDPRTPLLDCAFLTGVLASLTWDWALRQRLAGTNLNGFVLADCVVPAADAAGRRRIAELTLPLCAVLPWHDSWWRLAREESWWSGAAAPVRADAGRRALLVELELEVAAAFGLGPDDLAWILRDCDHPTARLADAAFQRTLDPKGFWRVDRGLPPAARLTVAVLDRCTATRPRLSRRSGSAGGPPAPPYRGTASGPGGPA